MPADAGIRFGQYVLARRIARGGMAEVFLAQQQGLEGFDRRVAVKRILPHLADSPDFVKMFLSEAKLAAQLSHPNIVHIYEFGKVEHDYFIAMEYVDGVHAGQLFKAGEHERLPATLVARIGADAANALHYAHELRGPTGKSYGLVHRDVSPANIMISFDGVVKLCDFGIAKAATAGDQLTNPGQVKGKYAYMSPEQTIASQLDGRSDVFSLAIVLWELLTGKYIVPRGDPVASMRMIRDGKLEPIGVAAPDVPAPLARAINWALESNREQRATAADLAQALEAFIKSSPEIATSMQLGMWVRGRFTRDSTGQIPALTQSGDSDAAAPSPGTQAGPGTVAAPGTAVGPATSAPLKLPDTPIYPPRRIVKLLEDTSDGTEIYSTSNLEDSATVQGPRPKPGQPFPPPTAPGPGETNISNATTSPRAAKYTAPSAPTLLAPDAEPTAVAGEEAFVGDQTDVKARPAAPADEEDSQNVFETVLRDRRTPIPSGPAVVPTRLQSPVPSAEAHVPLDTPALRTTVIGSGGNVPPSGVHPAPPSPASGMPVPKSGPGLVHSLSRDSRNAHTLKGTGTQHMLPRRPSTPDITGPRRNSQWPDPSSRGRHRKQLMMFGGLVGLAVLSFVIALAASSTKHSRGTAPARDAAVTVTAVEVDAGLPVAPPPLDASIEPTVPTIPDAGASPAAMGLLVVRTIPDGGTIKVGDQVRAASVQPGDETGARTAQLLLEGGRYTVIAELAGYQPEKRDVMLDRGENKMIEITFTKKVATSGKVGRLTVRTTPWSDVYLAGKKLGQAPFADLELPVGTHTLTFKNPSRPTITKTVTIKQGKLTKLNFSLP